MYRNNDNAVMWVALVLELVVRGVDHYRRHPVREDLVRGSGFGLSVCSWRGYSVAAEGMECRN